MKGAEHLAVTIRQKAASRFSLGYKPLVQPRKKQHLHRFQTASRKVADDDLIRRSRNHAHPDFLKTSFQNLNIILPVCLFISQKTFQAEKKFLHPLIDLTVLLCQVLIPRTMTSGKKV